MSRFVYVVNKGPHSYDAALQYGQLIYCTDGSLDRYDTAQMYRELNDAMRDSQPEDFILLTSLNSLCCVACGLFAAKHQRLNLLIHTKDQGYAVRELNFKGL